MAVENINPEKEPIPASWVPRVIAGGKEPPDGTSNIWLDRLPLGAMFIAVRRGEYKAYLHEIVWKGEEFTLLEVTFPDETTQDLYVHTASFCVDWHTYEYLGTNPPDRGGNNERE